MNRDEFRILALAELDAVARLARHLTPRAQDADDLVQETYLRAFHAGATYRPPPDGSGVRPWLLKILHNVANDRLSAEQRQRELAEGLANHAGGPSHDHGPVCPPGDAGTIADLSELNWDDVDGRLKAAIEQLPLALRTAFLLCAVEGLRYREIAEVMDVPVGTVMSRLYRARSLLSARLAGLGAEHGLPGAKQPTHDDNDYDNDEKNSPP